MRGGAFLWALLYSKAILNPSYDMNIIMKYETTNESICSRLRFQFKPREENCTKLLHTIITRCYVI